jgi:hypothetical protein
MNDIIPIGIDIALSVLVYNLTRVMNILGPQQLIQALRA